jgi:protein involved in polysaccharide export with SLBB domain
MPTVAQQGDFGLLSPGSTTNYRFAEPNELTIIVSVLGQIKNPGRYEVSRKLNLLDLLSLAGGWTDLADVSDITVVRTVQSGGRSDRRVIRFDLEDPVRVPESSLALEQGDYVTVGRLTSVSFQEAIAYVSAAAVILTAIVTLSNTGNSGN